VITGASSGIGAATARRAANSGYRVALAARSQDRLHSLVSELGGSDRALACRCDVTDWPDQEALVETTLSHFGRLDAVFANAGFGAKRGFLSESVEHWRSMVLTNVLGVALSIRAVLPHFQQADFGHVLLNSSVAGRQAITGSLYSATKWAVTAMAESLRQEVAGSGIRVTAIEPGAVHTPFFDSPPDTALDPDDIARAVVYALTQPEHVDVSEMLIRPASRPG
jgi:NADP-dependent 3-hydroxy acid dehydrogenase YdfG